MAYGGGNITFSNHSEGTANGSAASVFDYCHSLYLHSRILVPLLHAVAYDRGAVDQPVHDAGAVPRPTQALDRCESVPVTVFTVINASMAVRERAPRDDPRDVSVREGQEG
ncbi:hypothetical protein Q5P01_000055 [Channa striata]|uniref:Uncharacterized protein n=1 Tax=Channa striata TaxID=64152 RepID=A0AA88IS75_CHASR|nr:hypothetical protein Q5P01_000055 [Channa striata]